MHQISHVIAPFICVIPTPIANVPSSTWSADNMLQIIGDILTGVYVGATLVIVFLTFKSISKTNESLVLARQQMIKNEEQYNAAQAASADQSQAAIAAVNKQIETSPLSKQD